MHPWWAKGVMLVAGLALLAIRAPHGQRSRGVPIVEDRKDRREVVLVALVSIAFFLPLAWIATPLFRFAEIPHHLAALLAGAACLAIGLWLFYRSHADLGRNWSITLQVREDHRLVTDGVYRRIRHPMYTALFAYSLGQALVVPNWIVGPSSLVAFALLFALRLSSEERMMLDRFGPAYEAYRARTHRLIPGVW